MRTRTLTDTEVHGVLLNALYCAARTYDKLAEDAKGLAEGLRTQFITQAADARMLAEEIEQAASVELAP